MTSTEPDFDAFVHGRGRALLKFAYVLCGDAHLAEDLVQEVLARMHRRWDRITAMDSAEAYVRTAIVRQFLSWRRRRAYREAVLADVPEMIGLEDSQQRVVARDQMWRLLRGLPRAQRAVLVLRFYCDLPDDEIATLLGCGQSTVRSQAARALSRMRTIMSETGVGVDG
ncbi:SigE family RNA polymerase sigma factor [Actinoplanes awajinensis]|uniref:RNA polymerase subunit sigma-24 n=1 Tax=Actinoplanes awajinensis subsp. mycoplanecinus TaxID=135947 RepID=A0A101J9N0_9ACTN|nr:SigE family RNA polymerase sigma factor [Actinoplanes awajinensis]KUL22742.1 RNA polymerase subunit sigma-24 [Actinoplanes awajinensis subsp. mycoplanecinus]